jgi:hypothetical protein
MNDILQASFSPNDESLIMQFFNRQFSFLILLITVFLLFIPKLNLWIIDPTETAGLRIDDVILLCLALLIFWAHTFSRTPLYQFEGWILLITALGCFSFLINRLLVSHGILPLDAKLFYCFRLLEYFVFFYLGAILSHYFSGRKIIYAFFFYNLLLMSLQKLDLAGGMLASGYQEDVSGRVQGIASFPSEMGLLLNLLFCFIAFDDHAKSSLGRLFTSAFMRYVFDRIYFYLLFFVCGLFIIFTGNRISLVALLICFLFRLIEDLKLKSLGSYLSMTLLIPVISLAIVLTAKETSGVYERSAHLFSFKNLELFAHLWDKVDASTYPEEIETGANPEEKNLLETLGANAPSNAETYDMSWFIRIHKWLFMAKSYFEHPENYLQGLGPGYAGAALDGGLLRILTEYGLLGALLFWKFFASLSRLNVQSKWMIVSLVINMIFFDAYLAYKSMSFLLFACGLIFVRQQDFYYKTQAVAP